MGYIRAILISISNSVSKIISNMLLTAESITIISLGKIDDLARILLWAMLIDLISGMILDGVRDELSVIEIKPTKLLRKVIIFLTVALAMIVDNSVKHYGINATEGVFNLRNMVILNWIASECYHTYTNIDRVGKILGGWRSPKVLKIVLEKILDITDKVSTEKKYNEVGKVVSLDSKKQRKD